jgi:hypothetical protein
LLKKQKGSYHLTKSRGIRESQWNNAFQRVKAFIEQQNKLPRANCNNGDETALGAWLNKQQRKYNDGNLKTDRIKLLEQIGALIPTEEKEFLEKLEQCTVFILKNNRPPSSTATDPKEKSLYYWRSGQLHSRNIGTLKPHRSKLLEENGIFKTAYEHEWRSFFERLEHFVQANKRLPIRKSANPVEASLGQWRQQQFILYKNGKLTKENAERLESLGVATTVTTVSWGENFRKLHAFVTTRNSIPSRSSKNEDERQLSRWLETQQIRIKKNDLSDRRRRLIESLNVPESLLEVRWDKMIKEVQTFLNRNGQLPSSCAETLKERSLGVWCQKQKKKYAAGTLKPEQHTAIEELGLHLDLKSVLWRNHYKQVYLFIKENGRQPKRYGIDPIEKALGRWCERQRQLYSRKILSKDRAGALRTIKVIVD